MIKIDPQHLAMLTQIKFFFIRENKDMHKTSEQKGIEAKRLIYDLYQKYGFKAMRWAYYNAVGMASFMRHCKQKK